jgi:ATP-dependent helicase/nuclease subunit A
MIPFTDSQKLACDLSRHIAVTAGAGSGKTSVLVERYLWCLQNNGYQVRRIVAITFTEKAAGEMLSRIRAAILEYIRRGFGDPARWEDVLEHLSLAYISTIHGFCQRMLREFPVEAGVDPNFEVFDEAEARICLTHLIDEDIRRRAADYDDDLATLANLWRPGTLRNILLRLLAFRDTSLPWAEQMLGETFPDYRQRLRDLLDELEARGIRRLAADSRWRDTIAAIAALIPVGDSSKLTARCRNILDYDREFRTQTSREEQLVTLRMLRRDCRMITPSKKWKADDRNVRLKAALDQLKTLYDAALPALEFRDGLEQNGFQAQQALARVFLDVHARYQQEKRRRHVLDFDDLQERALALVSTPRLQAALARRYDYLMVDEFQDTNQVQWAIIRQLGMEHGAYAPAKFCIVGDEKQSIYMFRGAEVAVFGQVRRDLQQANLAHDALAVPPRIPPRGERPVVQPQQQTGELIMADNFRSTPALIAFFNHLFAHLFLSAFDPDRPYDVPRQNLLAARQPTKRDERFARLRETIAPIELLLNTPTNAADDDEDEPVLVARRVRELADAVRYEDIAILLRTRTRLKDFEDALRQSGIPFVVAGGIGFFQQQEIYDLANLLRFLVDARQDIALAGVLRSPLFNLSDDQLLFIASYTVKDRPLTFWDKLGACARAPEVIPEELQPAAFPAAYTLLTEWQAQADRAPITHLLREVFEATGLYGLLAVGPRQTQSRINLEKLLEIARAFERAGFQTLSDFVAYLDLLIEMEEREGEAQLNVEGINAVRLMTIHAAKGLQFPVVIVPELERPFNYGLADPLYLDQYRGGGATFAAVGIKALDPEQNDAPENTLLREYLKHLNAEKTDAEMKRLLYVACTRAQEHLALSGAMAEGGSKTNNSWLAWLDDLFSLAEALERGSLHIEEADRTVPIRTPAAAMESTSQAASVGDKPEERSQVEAALETANVIETLGRNLAPLHGPENERFTISPSTLHVLDECPRKFYYQELLRFPAPPDAPTPESAEAAPQYGSLRGTILHAIFERRWLDRDWPEADLLAAVAALPEVGRLSAGQREAMQLEAMVRRAYAHYRASGLRERLAAAPQVYRETPFTLPLGQARISGALDVLFFDPQFAAWTILDYKSNVIAAGQLADEIHAHGYAVQMQMYALAVRRLLRVERVRSLLFFTFPGLVYDAVDLSPAALEALEARLAAFLAHLAAGRRPACTTDARRCETCPYRGVCQVEVVEETNPEFS